MDPLVALGDHRAHAEQLGPFAAQSRDEPEPYSLPAMTISGVPLLLVPDGRVVDRHLLAGRDMDGPRALAARDEQVLEADVRERPSHHHLVPAPRAVGVEVFPLDTVLD